MCVTNVAQMWIKGTFTRVLLGAAVTCVTVPSSAGASDRCGYAAEAAHVARMEGDIPLVFRPGQLPAEARSRMRMQREHLLERARSERVQCPATATYLRGILARLLRASQLEQFARDAPGIRVVVRCEQGPPLPIARASAGKVILVPAALPGLADSEDAIAAVLAHELAHLTLRHAERLAAASAQPSPESVRRTKSAHEREADVTGLKILASAGYDARAAVDHLRAVRELAQRGRPARVDSGRPLVHDDADTRAVLLEKQIRACGYPAVAARQGVSAQVRRELAQKAPGLRLLAAEAGERSSAFGGEIAPVHAYEGQQKADDQRSEQQPDGSERSEPGEQREEHHRPVHVHAAPRE